MDYVRSCYTTMMRFDAGSPSELRPVRWYFTMPGAELFTAPTPFRSLNYRPHAADDGGLGEVGGLPRPYDRGMTPVPYPSLPRGCSPDADFLTGVTLGGMHPLAPSGVKACCYSSVPPGCDTFIFPQASVTLTLMDSRGRTIDIPLSRVSDNIYVGSVDCPPNPFPNAWQFSWQCGGAGGLMELFFQATGSISLTCSSQLVLPQPGYSYFPLMCSYQFPAPPASCLAPAELYPPSSGFYTAFVH
jgi:hypothetical protein